MADLPVLITLSKSISRVIARLRYCADARVSRSSQFVLVADERPLI
jgi:hypothetical protein